MTDTNRDVRHKRKYEHPIDKATMNLFHAWDKLHRNIIKDAEHIESFCKKKLEKTDQDANESSESEDMLRNKAKENRTLLRNLAASSYQMEYDRFIQLLPVTLRSQVVLAIERLRGTPTHPDELTETTTPCEPTELYLHVSQRPVLYTRTSQVVLDHIVQNTDIAHLFQRLPRLGTDHRAGIPGTLHRVGALLGKDGTALGCTIRLGRYIPFAGRLLVDLLYFGSVLVVSPPGGGKTTVLRDAVASLSRLPDPPRVVVIDTSNEIVGESDGVAPYFGGTRRLQVPSREQQLKVMMEGVQNHAPDILVIDEIGTEEEAIGVCSATQRGVRVLCTVHGSSLANIVRNTSLNRLLGGSQPVLLSYDEKRAKKKLRKTVLERMNPCSFDFVVQLQCCKENPFLAHVYKDLDNVVDHIFEIEDWKTGGMNLSKVVDLRTPIRNQKHAAFFD